MAVSLISEVVTYIAGSDLVLGERMVLMAIAEQANAQTRQAWQESGEGGKRRWVLSEVVGVTPTGLRAILQRLAKRGLEVRVPLGKDAGGRVVYAVYGRQTTYRLPELTTRGDGRKKPVGDTSVAPGDTSVAPCDTTVSPYPSVSRQSPNSMRAREPRQIVIENTDAKPSEADAVVARVANEVKPRSLGGFLVHLAKSGELQTWVGETRAARIKADAQEAEVADRKARRGLPRCEHGHVGGEQPHSATGRIRCQQCGKRQQAERINRTARSPDRPADTTVVDIRNRTRRTA